MKGKIFFCLVFFIGSLSSLLAQNITYSEVEKADNKNMTFEIVGKFSGNFIVYKYLYNDHKITIYDNDMVVKESIKLDFISDKTNNIDFIAYSDNFLMVWQYQRKNIIYCKAARMNSQGKQIGDVIAMDSTKEPAFSANIYYSFKWSEDKKKLLMYKYSNKNDAFNLITKVYDENVKCFFS